VTSGQDHDINCRMFYNVEDRQPIYLADQPLCEGNNLTVAVYFQVLIAFITVLVCTNRAINN